MSRWVKCADCELFVANPLNPEAGAGKCTTGANHRSVGYRFRADRTIYAVICWPHALRSCREHTAHERYEFERAAWIAANANATPQEYEQAMRERAERAGV